MAYGVAYTYQMLGTMYLPWSNICIAKPITGELLAQNLASEEHEFKLHEVFHNLQKKVKGHLDPMIPRSFFQLS